MLIALVGILSIVALCIISLYTYKMKEQNLSEYNNVEDLKRRIDELDDDNVDTDSTGTAKIIVPDIVDSNEATRKSTQKEECKEYTVGPKQKIEKTVIGEENKTETFVNTKIERVEDEEDNPIKENEGLISKILKNNKDEE